MKITCRNLGTGVLFLTVFLLFCTAAHSENIDPDNNDSQYAWGENVGWLNLDPDADGDPGVQVVDFELTGYMWGENIGWISLSCANTGTCDSGVDYGVVNDGVGNLSGYAWGENVGWIDFGPAQGGVTIDPATGEFSGYAWGENIGWINFGPAQGSAKTSWRGDSDGDGVTDDLDAFPNDPAYCLDDDGDGMPDEWEDQIVVFTTGDDIYSIYDVSPEDDFDGDGWDNMTEYKRNTDPTDPESHPPNAMPWIPLLLLDE